MKEFPAERLGDAAVVNVLLIILQDKGRQGHVDRNDLIDGSNPVEEAAAEDKAGETTTRLESKHTCVPFARRHDSTMVADF